MRRASPLFVFFVVIQFTFTVFESHNSACEQPFPAFVRGHHSYGSRVYLAILYPNVNLQSAGGHEVSKALRPL